jgi:hypothetical protein
MLERQIEQRLRIKIKAIGGLALKFVSPGVVGVPDRIILLPGGRIYFVELKAPGKKPSPKQVKMAQTLASLGHPVRVIDSMEKVKEFINEIRLSWFDNIDKEEEVGK